MRMTSPAVATTSGEEVPELARWVVEIDTAASSNMPFARIAPLMQTAHLRRDVGHEVATREPTRALSTIDTTGLKCAPETGPEHEDERGEAGGGGGGVLEQLQARIIAEVCGRDAGADHERGEQRRPEETPRTTRRPIGAVIAHTPRPPARSPTGRGERADASKTA